MPDPDEHLGACRNLAAEIRAHWSDPAEVERYGRSLAHRFLDLDEALTAGRPLPAAWAGRPELEDPAEVARLTDALYAYDYAAGDDQVRAARELAEAAKALLARIDEAVAR